jgi:hypothetical protein
MEKEEKRQVNLFLDVDLLEKAQKKAEESFMKFNGYISKLITQDLEGYSPTNAFGEDLNEDRSGSCHC